MRALLAVARKDLVLLSRDPGALFWAGVFPVLFGVLFAAVFPSSSSRPAIAVALSGDPALVAALRAAEGAPLAITVVASAEEGRARVRRGEAAAAVEMAPGVATVVADPSHPAEGAVVEVTLFRAFASPSHAMPEPCRASPDPCFASPIVRRVTADLEASAPSGFSLAFPAAMLWGLIGCAGAFASASVAERRSGTHLRLRASPVPAGTVLAGKVLACLAAAGVVSALLLLVARIFFDVHVERPAVLAIAIGACAACFAGLTTLLGSVGRSEQSVGGAGWAVLLLLAMIGGAMVPLSVMPAWMRAAANASPVKWGIVVLEGATFRRATLAELAPGLLVLVGAGLTCIALASALTRRGAE